jgi:alginate O-acetyltransferase complex protein AlgI
MLFHSFPFLFFLLPATLLCYWVMPARGLRLGVLTLASYLFYGWWDYRFCGLLLLSSLVDYFVGDRIVRASHPGRRRVWLLLSIITNLSILGAFKYWDIFAASTTRVLHLLGFQTSAPLFHLVLPVGLSFYTFQTMSYTIDIYRGQARPSSSLIKYLAFVSMFPQLVMGPIVRWGEVEDQLEHVPRWPEWRVVALGMNFFILGLAKKVLVADALYPLVDPHGFASLSVLEFWPWVFGWAFWVYYGL